MRKPIIFFTFIFVLISQVMANPQAAITIDDIDLNPNDTPLLSLDQRNQKILQALKDNGNLQAACLLAVCGLTTNKAEIT